MADVRWEIAFKDKVYEFDAEREFTSRRLTQYKKWYGADYGRYNTMVVLLAQGDADAWACVIWTCLDNAGDPKPSNPTFLDFPVGELMNRAIPDKSDEDDAEEEWDGTNANPTSPPPTPESPDSSTKTWEDSEGDSSSS